MNCRNPVATLSLALLLLMPRPAYAQEVIFLMRHAEPMRSAAQPADPNPPLSEAGQRRALALAARLKDAAIQAIFVTDTVRTQQTAEPTARALGLQPQVTGRQEIDSLVALVRVQHPNDRVLIVNHALNIQGLLKAMGQRDAPEVAVGDFEPLFIVVPRGERPPLVVMLRL